MGSTFLKYSNYLDSMEDELALKLLLDEMYAGLKEYFQILGWQVVTVHDEGLKGKKDRDVVEHAKKHDLLLVTQDPKPADLAELTGTKYVLISNAMIAKIADEKIREKYPSLYGMHATTNTRKDLCMRPKCSQKEALGYESKSG